MPKYVIEREMPGAGQLNEHDLQSMSRRACAAINDLSRSIQWVESFVTESKMYCVFIAPSAEVVAEHARLGGFPVDRISEVKTMIDPTTAEGI